MPSGLILAIDQGTTNTKALLVGRSGTPVFRASVPIALIHAAQGHVEQDPEEIWESVRRVIGDCVSYASQSGSSIGVLAITNQRETAIAWNVETGNAIGNAISWQCTRSAEICQRLEPHADAIRAVTGLPLATLISAGKWAWLLEYNEQAKLLAQAKVLRFGTMDAWLIHRLTGGLTHATDFSMRHAPGCSTFNIYDGIQSCCKFSEFHWQRCLSCEPLRANLEYAAASQRSKARPF